MKKIIVRRVVFLICSILVMLAIVFFSAQNGETSGNLSQGFAAAVRSFLEKILPEPAVEFIISRLRKMAHVFLYACLGVFVSCFVFTFPLGHGWAYFAVPWLFCLAYACSDEIHQFFVPGRACMITDVCIDAIGFTFTTLVANVIHTVGGRKRRKKIRGQAEKPKRKVNK